MPICGLCGDSGVFSLKNKTFCLCIIGKSMRKNISEGIPCCLCENKGVVSIIEDGTGGIGYYYCECSHGDELKKETKKNPTSCPVCHGLGVYNWISGKDGDNTKTRKCICSK